MVRGLFELLFWVAIDPLGLGAEQAWRAWQRNAANSQPWPYDWKNRVDDPVYKKNLQRLIERNREFEEAWKRNERPS